MTTTPTPSSASTSSTMTGSPTQESMASGTPWLTHARVRMGLGSALVALVALQCTSSFDPFPYWAIDPTAFWAPPTGILPAEAMLIDLVIMLIAGAVLVLEWQARRGVWRGAVALGVIGGAGVVWHMLGSSGVWVEHVRIGTSWMSAVFAGIAAFHLGRDGECRRVMASLCVGLIAVLAAKGVFQYFIEHQNTVRTFRETSEQFLAANGWSPGSEQAKAFERRLMQPEATGWFGLANVFASFAAACAVALAGSSVLAARAWLHTGRDRRARATPLACGIVGLATLIALASVLLAGSKAGVLVCLIGLTFVALTVLLSRAASASASSLLARLVTPRRAGWLALMAVAAALLAVVVRGQIGERLGERSLLVRWFYMQGASRVIAQEPVMGVGPAGFKDAYLIAKSPMATESVESPHSIAFDWIADLGLAGWAWTALLGWMVFTAGKQLASRANEGEPTLPPSETEDHVFQLRCMLAAVCLPMFAGVIFERYAVTEETLLIRSLGGAFWFYIARSLVQLLDARMIQQACVPAAIVLAVHAQLEMTFVRPGAAPWAWIMVGLAAAPTLMPLAASATKTSEGGGHASVKRDWLSLGTASAPACLAAAVMVIGWWPVRQWQTNLANAEAMARPTDVPDYGAIGRPPEPRPHEDLVRAIAFLGLAAKAGHAHDETLEAQSRLALVLALDGYRPEVFSKLAIDTSAEAIAKGGTRVPRASPHGWHGTILDRVGMANNDRALRDRARDAWEQAAALDPHGLTFPQRLALQRAELGDVEGAARWAKRALEIDASLRLDPLVQLSPAARGKLEEIARKR